MKLFDKMVLLSLSFMFVHVCQNRGLEEERQQEETLLMAASAPLRQYLTNTVLPTVIRGCLEICELRPEDPIDFLVGFLTLYM